MAEGQLFPELGFAKHSVNKTIQNSAGKCGYLCFVTIINSIMPEKIVFTTKSD